MRARIDPLTDHVLLVEQPIPRLAVLPPLDVHTISNQFWCLPQETYHTRPQAPPLPPSPLDRTLSGPERWSVTRVLSLATFPPLPRPLPAWLELASGVCKALFHGEGKKQDGNRQRGTRGCRDPNPPWPPARESRSLRDMLTLRRPRLLLALAQRTRFRHLSTRNLLLLVLLLLLLLPLLLLPPHPLLLHRPILAWGLRIRLASGTVEKGQPRSTRETRIGHTPRT